MELLTVENVISTTWYLHLDQKQKLLVRHAIELYQRELQLESELSDYSFLIFTMSKAYEGFLKKYLRDINFISESVYQGRRFRIGRALNPDVHPDQRDKYWLYDDLVRACGEELARQMWETWLQCRNRIFHYFPKDPNIRDFAAAKKCLLKMVDTMDRVTECKLTLNN